MPKKTWLNRNVWLISLSATFADLGYQTIIAGFPIFLVMSLGASYEVFGVASALAYGIGSFLGYLGGKLSDVYGSKRIAVIGNSLIILLSLIGFTNSVFIAIGLFSFGWWARNFRSPARRVMLLDAAGSEHRQNAFGFLHALDVGGGLLSILVMIFLIYNKQSLNQIFLLTSIPILISTILLAISSSGERPMRQAASQKPKSLQISKSTFYGVIMSTALYGFSSFSLGFPILTVAQSNSSVVLGVASYALFLGVSAFVGYWIGGKRYNLVKSLSFMGYVVSAAGSFALGWAYYLHANVVLMLASVAVLGFGLGVIETIEPTIISIVSGATGEGEGMGALSGSRSFGLFLGNVIMGILYALSPLYSYSYAAAVSLVAALIMLHFGRRFNPHLRS